MTAGVEGLDSVLDVRFSREDLADQLRAPRRPSRLLYVGHVSSAIDGDGRPESAALYLSDHHTSSPDGIIGRRRYAPHRPFTASDIVVGTLDAGAAAGGSRARSRLSTEPTPGHRVWPMPPRVALLACDSGSDHRFVEAFGLVVAIMLNGAEMVTAIRWARPTDHAFHDLTGVSTSVCGTADMVVAVDADVAHDQDDPARALNRGISSTARWCWRRWPPRRPAAGVVPSGSALSNSVHSLRQFGQQRARGRAGVTDGMGERVLAKAQRNLSPDRLRFGVRAVGRINGVA